MTRHRNRLNDFIHNRLAGDQLIVRDTKMLRAKFSITERVLGRSQSLRPAPKHRLSQLVVFNRQALVIDGVPDTNFHGFDLDGPVTNDLYIRTEGHEFRPTFSAEKS
jgi:hypothetical protein